jgi:hypothetical protein
LDKHERIPVEKYEPLRGSAKLLKYKDFRVTKRPLNDKTYPGSGFASNSRDVSPGEIPRFREDQPRVFSRQEV